MVVTCSVYGCLSTSQSQSNRSFFRFPKDEARCKLWVKAADRPDLLNKSVEDLYKSHVMCDLHFKAEDRNSKKLRSDTVPSLNLPLRHNVHATISTQTDVNTSQYFLKYESATQTMPNDIEATEHTIDSTSEDEHDCFASTANNDTGISPQVKDSHRGKKNDKKIKLMALNLFFTSPLSYRVVAKFLSLPSVRALRRMKIDMGTKVDSSTLSYLQTKLKNLPELDKYCIVCADEISLKRNLHYVINKDKIVGFHEVDGVQTDEPATQACVVMVRGIFSNWQLPIGYCLLASSEKYEELKSWLNGLISKILNIGYYVVGFVTGQGSNFIKLANERNVSVDKPYFYIDDRKIYNIFDVPHLFKLLRNNLMKYNFEFLNSDGKKVTAKWEDIKTFYRYNSEKSLSLAPKLTEAHINPNNLEKMEVKYATQVFSYTLAAAMDFILEKSCSGTVRLISLMDKTYDVLNSSAVKHQNKNKTAYTAKQHQTEILNEFGHFLSTVAVVNDKKKDVTKSIKCLQGFKITLSSIRSLAKDLQSVGFKFLLTHRLNKDPIDNFFGFYRRQRHCRKPTPIQFSRDFYKLYMMNILKHSDHANSSDDFDTLLKYAKDKVASIQQQKEEGVYSDSIPTVTVGTLDYRFELPENNAFLYVCCYLLKKCTEIHQCESMIAYLGTNSQLSEDSIFSSSSNQRKNILITPPKSFIACIKAMDDKFKLCFQKSIPESIGNHILKELSSISITKCCPCFPNEYLKKLFVRFRIFNVLRFNNRVLKYKSFKVKHVSVCSI